LPKRVIDFDAVWASDKLAHCAPWARAEYTWVYGLADANGSFELTNLRVIFGRAYAIREDISIEQLSRVLEEFQDKGLLFVWEENGKKYGHWTGSDVPGRLPPPSWRARLERLAPPVPRAALAQYRSAFSISRIKAATGEAQTQDLDWVSDKKEEKQAAAAESHTTEVRDSQAPVNRPGETAVFDRPLFDHARLRISPQLDSKLAREFPDLAEPARRVEYECMAAKLEEAGESARSAGNYARAWLRGLRGSSRAAKALSPRGDVRTGTAPLADACGVRVKPAALERIQARDAARNLARDEGRQDQHQRLRGEPKEKAS
jgi:hypothetical protein